jgi:hypothetical protein
MVLQACFPTGGFCGTHYSSFQACKCHSLSSQIAWLLRTCYVLRLDKLFMTSLELHALTQ